MGLEPMTSSLPTRCSTAELQGRISCVGAGGENRTRDFCLEGRGITTMQRPRLVGRAGFEPAYRDAEQIYSLSPLTTRPPTHASAAIR